MKTSSSTKTDVLIVGLGNVLLGDEGIGVHVVRCLDKYRLPDGVEILDGGTGGFHLLGPLCEAKKLIFIDATCDESPAGTINRIQPKYSSDYPVGLSAHDIGLKDMLDAMYLIGSRANVTLYTISIETPKGLSLTLSPAVEAAVAPLIGLVQGECAGNGCPAKKLRTV